MSDVLSHAPVAHPGVPIRDVRIAAGYGILTLVLSWTPVGSSGLSDGAVRVGAGPVLVLLLAGCAATVLRRARPLVTLAVAGSISLLVIVVDGHLAAYVLLFEALWSAVVHGSARAARISTLSGAAIGVIVLVATASWGAPSGIIAGLLIVAVAIGTPLLWGWEVRHHQEARRTAEALVAVEHQLASERSARAVDTERRRIAQDLHDLVAGHVSAVALHAELAATLPETAARDRSLATARDSARAALRDLRGLIELLVEEGADDAASAAPTLSWADLEARLSVGEGGGAATTGSPTRIDPAIDDPARVDPVVRAVALRIAAEAVTNALKHGGPPWELRIEVEPEGVELTCRNARTGDGRTGIGTGLGLSIIEHQARTVGGDVLAGADPEDPRCWALSARLPHWRVVADVATTSRGYGETATTSRVDEEAVSTQRGVENAASALGVAER